MSDTSDLPKPSDQFDSSETNIRNCETCLEGGFTVSSVVYKATGIDRRYKHSFSIVFVKLCDRLDDLKLYSVLGSEFLIDHAHIVC